MGHVGSLARDHLGGAEAAPGGVLAASYLPKITALLAGIELCSDALKGRLAHAAPKSIAHQCPLVDDGFPLEVAATGVGYGVPCLQCLVGPGLESLGAFASLGHDHGGLVPEGCCDLSMRGEYLRGSQDLLAVAGRVRRDLGGL